MSDAERPVDDATVLRAGLEEMVGLQQALEAAVGEACDKTAAATQRDVHPDMLAALLMKQAGEVALRWGRARQLKPDEIERYFEDLCRRARRGLRIQITQALTQGRTPR